MPWLVKAVTTSDHVLGAVQLWPSVCLTVDPVWSLAAWLPLQNLVGVTKRLHLWVPCGAGPRRIPAVVLHVEERAEPLPVLALCAFTSLAVVVQTPSFSIMFALQPPFAPFPSPFPLPLPFFPLPFLPPFGEPA